MRLLLSFLRAMRKIAECCETWHHLKEVLLEARLDWLTVWSLRVVKSVRHGNHFAPRVVIVTVWSSELAMCRAVDDNIRFIAWFRLRRAARIVSWVKSITLNYWWFFGGVESSGSLRVLAAILRHWQAGHIAVVDKDFTFLALQLRVSFPHAHCLSYLP